VRWLAGYRHPRHAVTEVGDVLLEAFREQSPLMAGAHQVGDPIAVLPVLFHLIWAQQLVSDLTVPLDADIAVVARR